MADDIKDCGWSNKDKEHRREDLLRYFCLLRLRDHLRHINTDLLCLLGWMPREIRQGCNFYCFQNGGNAAQFLILKIVR